MRGFLGYIYIHSSRPVRSSLLLAYEGGGGEMKGKEEGVCQRFWEGEGGEENANVKRRTMPKGG